MVTNPRYIGPKGARPLTYAKLFSSIVHSTVWREEMHVKVVWITMLALANRHGEVHASIPGLADASKVSLPQCEEALERLSAPDAYSRTKEYEGRRIANMDGGWLILTYVKHRDMVDREEEREKTRLRVAKHRAKKAVTPEPSGNAVKRDVRPVASATPSTPTQLNTNSTPEPTSTDSAPAATALVCPGCAAIDTLWVDDVGRWHCHSVRGCGKAFEADDRRIASQPEKSLDDAPKALAKPLPKKQRGGPDVRAVFGHWKRVMGHPDAKLTREREAKVKARLAEGYTVEQLNGAVDGCKASPHHMGRNDTGTIYDDLELICRSGGKVESFVAKQPVLEPAPVEEKWTPEERSQAIAERDRRLYEMRDRAKRGREGDDRDN